MDKDNIIEKGPDGGFYENDVDAENKHDVNKYQKWIRAAKSSKAIFNKWAKAGKEIYRGYKNKNTVTQASQINVDIDSANARPRINFIRKPIERQIQKTYSRNPTFMATPNQPIFVDAPPVPAPPVQSIDPATGQPVMVPQINPATGQPLMVPQIDPATGQPVQVDVSNQIIDVVEQLMSIVFEEADFKAEAKACTREAHHSPGSVMQIGYQFDEQEEIDQIYFRRRKFENFIIDPQAEIYEGVVRRCRFQGLKWELTKEEAENMGLDWSVLIADDDNLCDVDSQTDKKATVYNIWDKQSGVVAWCPESGDRLAKELEPWPWKIKGFPFKILKYTEDTDEQFSKSLVIEAKSLQEELTIQRSEITENTTNSRPYTIYDPLALDSTKMDNISKREKRGMIAVKGLLGMPNEPFRRIGDSNLTPEYYSHYERCKQELNEVLGTSANEALQATDTTAKEAEIIAGNASTGTNSKIDIQTDFLNACAMTAVQIMKQTYTTERVTQVIGRNNERYWVRWVGSQIMDKISIKVETGSTEREDTAYNRQVSLNMLEIMKGIPGIDVVKLAMEVLKDHGKRNPDDYILNQQMSMVDPTTPANAGAGATTGTDISGAIAGQVSPMV